MKSAPGRPAAPSAAPLRAVASRQLSQPRVVVLALALLSACNERSSPSAVSPPPAAAAAAVSPPAAELPVDRLLRRLTAWEPPCRPERTGELFELASLLTTRDRALATEARAQPTARIVLQALTQCTGWQRGTVLAALGALAATWPQAQKALYDGGAVAQLRLLLADEVAERRRGQALFALGALFPAHERAGLEAAALRQQQELDRTLLRAGLTDPSRFIHRQAILAATLARDEALDDPLLAALRFELAQLTAVPARAEDEEPATAATRGEPMARSAAPPRQSSTAALPKALPSDSGSRSGLASPAPSVIAAGRAAVDPAMLQIPAVLTPAQGVELLPLMPSFIDLLLSLPPPRDQAALAKALQLAQVVAAASPRSATAQFLLAQVQSRRRDPAAAVTLRRALALGNLPGVFLAALGPSGRSLTTPIDIAAARQAVRAELAKRPAAALAPAASVTTAALGSGQLAIRSVSPAALEAQAVAVVRGPGPDSAAARALGAELFASYPFGSEDYYDPCLRSFLSGNNQDLLVALGLSVEKTSEGGRLLVGVVKTAASEPARPDPPPSPDRSRYGVTCALCHAQVDEQGIRRDGLPSRTYDQGLLLAACVDQPIHEKSGNRNLLELLDYRPGRNDSSSDGVHNPTDIPSLFGLRVGGPVRWNGDTPTLEVQIDRNLSSHSAPPEVIALVAAYLRQLPLPPPAAPAVGTERLVASGAQVFQRTCRRCHAPPAYTTGEIIAQPELSTDVTRVSAVLPNSSEGYKIPSLLRISRSAPYLHDGSVPTLEKLLDLKPPSRLRRPETAGHRFGLTLPPRDRWALLAFLRTL